MDENLYFQREYVNYTRVDVNKLRDIILKVFSRIVETDPLSKSGKAVKLRKKTAMSQIRVVSHLKDCLRR